MSPRKVGGAVLAAALILGGCTGDNGSEAGPGPDAGDGSGTTSGSVGPTPYLPVPEGVVLTDQGSELGVGETAVVAIRPRPGRVGVLQITVRKLVRAPIKALQDWQLDAVGRSSSLFYVTVTVTNLGEEDLAGRRIPLYVADDDNALLESNEFKTDFEPCPSPPLPEPFTTGDKTTACLVYLVPEHGRLASVTFRPSEKFNPITWVGKVVQPKKPKKPEKGGDEQE